MSRQDAITYSESGAFTRFAARAAGPLLFGLRLWASVCLALYLAFKLELADPGWAGTTAALVCQPQLGASLRKSSFRLLGTIVGAVAMCVIAAAFPQDRIGFLGGLALWAGLCGFAGALLKNFAAYAAGLAGFTAAIIASDLITPNGGANGEAVTFAILRVAEIAIGIVSAGVVLALTDLGHARRQLSDEVSSVVRAMFHGFADAVSAADPNGPAARSSRREILRRVIALDPMIDTAIGEASDLRYRSRILQDAVTGLVEAITAWRVLAIHRGQLLPSNPAADAAPVQRLVENLRARSPDPSASPAEARDAFGAAARKATALPCSNPSSQLLADAAARAFIGMARALNGLTLLVDPPRTRRADALSVVYVPDWLPPAAVALRAFLATALVSLLWIVTAWPDGMMAVIFTVIASVLFPLQGDRAYSAALGFLAGCVLSAVLAGLILFGILPGVSTFMGLSLTLGLAFIPLGLLVAWPWQAMFFTATTFNIVPFLGLKNAIVYDAAQFLNSVLAILFGLAAGVMMIRLVPPPSPQMRTRRLLRFALADVRRLASGAHPRLRRTWQGRTLARLVALPDAAAPIERAYMSSALAVGARILRLRDVAPRFVPAQALDRALAPIAEGRVDKALPSLARLERELTAAAPNARIALRLRAATLAIAEELGSHPEFFEQRVRT